MTGTGPAGTAERVSTPRRWLVFEPVDTVAVRDGRAFDAGSNSVARVVLPHPGAVGGAVGAAYGARPGAGADRAEHGRSVPAALHGPVVVQRLDTGRWRARFPQPRVMVRDGEVWHRLAPPGDRDWDGVSSDLDGAALLPGPVGETGGWVDGAALGRFLTDPHAVARAGAAPWVTERRVGLARNDDRTARDGMLYSAEHLRPAVGGRVHGAGFAVGCVDPPDRAPADMVFLGGEGRRAQVHDWTSAGASGPLPDPPVDFGDGRVLLYLATPALFTGGWRPADADLRGGRLVAAAVGAPQEIALGRPDRRTGALTARRLLWAAPAGSVYFLDFGRDVAAAMLAAAAWHGSAFTPQHGGALATAGFGLALIGRW
ncbi:type III-B CRISPR module-associated Cmr3 family protein [Dactylosporangium sp. NPDC049525]|uniref:type III-B CRISPR module-associated Cmr3 family protein n=1 Tax=Dactylosporangium sp. NPDC049525 TaxID=3154730 RepID=UPI00342BE154